MTTPNETLDMIEERHNLKTIIEVPFDPARAANALGDDGKKTETIFLLDETGARRTTLLRFETVGDALALLGENAQDIAFVLFKEERTIASLLHSV